MTKCAIHVIDADAACRLRMASLLAPLGQPIYLHAAAEAFLNAVLAEPIGCLIAACELPGLGGLALMKRLHGAALDAPCLLVTRDGSLKAAVHAMQAGATAVLEQPIEADELIRQVQTCFAKQRSSLNLRQRSSQVRRALASLSSGESAVLQDLLEGKANKAVAYDLAISERTVEMRRAKIMKKLGVRSIAQLVRDVVVAQVEQEAGYMRY